jgi:hypothetical protein
MVCRRDNRLDAAQDYGSRFDRSSCNRLFRNRWHYIGISARELAGLENVLKKWRAFTAWRVGTWRRARIDRNSKRRLFFSFVTAGSACASRDRWNLCGYWLYGEREINVHDPGPSKRSLNISEVDAANILNIAKRSRELIATVPIENPYRGFSKPRVPDWLDERIGNWARQDNETREIMKARFGIDED